MKIAGLAGSIALTLVAIRLPAEPLPAEIAMARRLFNEARAAESNKDWTTAAAKLHDAVSIKETAGLRFHLAYCEEQQGMLVEALNDYERAEELLTQPNDDFRTQLPTRKESLHKRIPTITLVMPPDVTDASLSIDDHPLASSFLGKAIPLNPGKHTVLVTSPNRVPFSAELTLNETDAVVTNAPMLPVVKPLAASPAAPPVSPTADAAPSPSGGSQVRTYVLVGEAVLTVGALALGIGSTIAASNADSRVSSDQGALGSGGCHQDPLRPMPLPPMCADLQEALDSRSSDKSIATVGFVGAGVGALAFAGTLLFWTPGRSKTAIAPILAPGVSGISVATQF
jgi:hypothetical protein